MVRAPHRVPGHGLRHLRQVRGSGMSVLWHYIQNGTTLGPIPEEQLRGLISSGVLQPSDHVWHDGLAAWTTIQASPELASLSIPPPVRSLPGSPQPGSAQPQMASGKPNKTLLWVLGGCGGLLLLVLIGFAATAFWVRQKVAKLQRNPAVAAAE